MPAAEVAHHHGVGVLAAQRLDLDAIGDGLKVEHPTQDHRNCCRSLSQGSGLRRRPRYRALERPGQAYSRRMTNTPNRTTVDLSAYPDLVVIYLGMRVDAACAGYATLPPLRTRSIAGHGRIQGPGRSAAPRGTSRARSTRRTSACASTGATSSRLERWTRSHCRTAVVARLPTRPRRHRLLARDLLRGAGHRVGLRRLRGAPRPHARIAPVRTRPRRRCSRPVSGAPPIGRAQQQRSV